MLIANLTPREREVLDLLVECGCNKKIARRVNKSEATVKTWISSIFRKVDVGDDRVLLAVWWDRQKRAQ